MNMNRIIRIAEKISENSLDGLTNIQARREVQKVTHRNTPRGILHDAYWRGPNQVWKALNFAAFDWEITNTFYDKDSSGNPERKTWRFEIHFVNAKGRKTTIYGTLIAAGAGTVETPLESYDVVVTTN